MDQAKTHVDRAVGKWVLSSCGISFSQMRIAAREHRHDMPPLRAITRFQRYLRESVSEPN